MKYSDLFEDTPPADTTASPEPTGPTPAWTPEYVQYAIDKLKVIQTKEKYQRKVYDASFKYAFLRLDLALEIMQVWPEYRKIIDALEKAEADKDVDMFQLYAGKLWQFTRKINLSEKQSLAKKKVATHFNIAIPLENTLIKCLNAMTSWRDGSEVTLKRMQMTDQQKATSLARSRAMQARWYE
jgi:hypothetical protein